MELIFLKLSLDYQSEPLSFSPGGNKMFLAEKFDNLYCISPNTGNFVTTFIVLVTQHDKDIIKFYSIVKNVNFLVSFK